MAADDTETSRKTGDLVMHYLSSQKPSLGPAEILGLTRDMRAILWDAPAMTADLVKQAISTETGRLTVKGLMKLTRQMKEALGGAEIKASKQFGQKDRDHDPEGGPGGGQSAAPSRHKIDTFATRVPQRDPVRDGPAVPINQSYTREYIICLEDGAKLKFLKRHLDTYFNMTPEQYLKKWNLPADYPLVAEAYSARRKRMAKRRANEAGEPQTKRKTRAAR